MGALSRAKFGHDLQRRGGHKSPQVYKMW